MSNSLVTGIYECIRERLLVGYYPPGTHLDYKRISCELHVSTTPVREAVGRLAGDGLVELIPRAGASVKHVEPDELVWLFEAREALELYALRCATKRITSVRLAAMEQFVERLRLLADEYVESSSSISRDWICAEFRKLDLAFHMSVITAAENQQLTKIAGNTLLLTWLARGHPLRRDNQAGIEIVAAHKAICDALRVQNGEKAIQVCKEHIKQDFELTLREQKSSSDFSRCQEASERQLKAPWIALKSRPKCTASKNNFLTVV